ncbi:MAG: ribonuclease HII [Patescibacteria group bacterium]
MKVPHKTIERELFKSGHRSVIGVDEVGMGCLAGPVVVCAVAISPAFYQKSYRKLAWLRDSKLLTSGQREVFSKELLSNPHIKAGISFCYPETIDRVNIYQAARLAMRRSIKKLSKHARNPFVLVDGDKLIHGLEIPQRAIIRGDRTVFAIACASIIAKVRRDKMMVRYAKKFPGYGLEQHKGYGTKFHQERLLVLGPTSIHRRSFAPVGKLV